MLSSEEIINRLWKQYVKYNPHASRIHGLLKQAGESVVIDHIAIRTVDDKRVNINALMRPFFNSGYVPCAQYDFPVKKLFAKHYENKKNASAPKIFISELQVKKFSPFLQAEVKKAIDTIPIDLLKNPMNLLLSPRPWAAISFSTCEKIKSESPFAAWLIVFGYGVNHIGINVNHLKKYDDMEKIKKFVIDHGYEINTTGGAVQGSPKIYLEQLRTVAEMSPFSFSDGVRNIPTSYCEFVKRYVQPNGELFNGFIAGSVKQID